ncbi:MAG: type II toxin-antitoxin system HicA family toxin [Methylovirgula sp.]
MTDEQIRLNEEGIAMSQRLEAMRGNPAGDWRIEDVTALCREFGLICEPPRGGGSHYKVGHPSMAEKLTIPFRRPIKVVYIRMLVAFIDAVRTLK